MASTAVKYTILMSGGAPYVMLPQYLAANSATVLEGFEVYTDWAVLAGGTRAADTTNVRQGSASLKITTTGGTPSSVSVTKVSALNVADKQYFRIWLYCHDANVTGGNFYFSQSNFTKYAEASIGTVVPGWNVITKLRTDFALVGGFDWNAAIDRIRVRILAANTVTAVGSSDRLEGLISEPVPAVVFTFDDGYSSTYSAAFDYMRGRNVPGVVYVITDLIETADRLTVPQLQEMNNAGWDIGNHTVTHPDLTTLTQAQVEDELTGAQTALEARGLTRASKHVAYPGGQYNDTVLAAMTAAGMLTGRKNDSALYATIPPAWDQYVDAQYIIDTTTLAAAKAKVDAAVSAKRVAVLVFHHLVETPSHTLHWAISDFRALVDYVVAQNIQVVTMSQFHDLQSGSVLARKAV